MSGRRLHEHPPTRAGGRRAGGWGDGEARAPLSLSSSPSLSFSLLLSPSPSLLLSPSLSLSTSPSLSFSLPLFPSPPLLLSSLMLTLAHAGSARGTPCPTHMQHAGSRPHARLTLSHGLDKQLACVPHHLHVCAALVALILEHQLRLELACACTRDQPRTGMRQGSAWREGLVSSSYAPRLVMRSSTARCIGLSSSSGVFSCDLAFATAASRHVCACNMC